MVNNANFVINIEIIINRKLYERKVIDEDTFTIVNDVLLRKLKGLQ